MLQNLHLHNRLYISSAKKKNKRFSKKNNFNSLLYDNNFYRQYFESTSESILFADPRGVVISANRHILNLLSYSANEIEGTPLSNIIYSDDLNIFRLNFSQIELGQKCQTELRILKKDKDILHVNFSGHPFFQKDNSVAGMFIFLSDITERKILEEALIESESRFKLINENISDIVSLLTPEGIIKYVSSACTKITGYGPNELIGHHIFQFLHPDDIKRSHFIFKKFFIVKTLSGLALRIRHKNGDYVWCETEGKLIFKNRPDEISEIQFTTKDISVTKKVEEKLEWSHANLISLFESAAEIIWCVNVNNFGIINFNTSLRVYIKSRYSVDLEPGMTPADIYPMDVAKSWYDLYNQTLIQKKINLEYNAGCNYGIYNVSLNVITKGNEVIGISVMANDITEKKNNETELNSYRLHLEELVIKRTKSIDDINSTLRLEIEKQKEICNRLKKSFEKEKEQNELKSRFISIASHEFRTPLTIVLSSTELLERYGNNWSGESVYKQIHRIKHTVSYLNDMISDILTISRAETGKITYSPQKTNLKILSNNLIENISVLLTPKHKMAFSYNISRSIFICDERLIQYALSNLLSNAIKYSPDGGEIKVRVDMKDGAIVFEISDKGIGIPEKDMQYLFEPFHRCSNIGDIEGTGLGMSIVKRTLELHHGLIHCDSIEGKGTTFLVTIPSSF